MILTSMKKCLRSLMCGGIPWMLLAMPLAAGTVRVYVTNHAGTTISVVDPSTNKVVQELKDIEVPEAVQVSPDGSRVYISQAPENIVTVLDRATGKLIKRVPISGHANDMAVTHDGKLILVCISEVPGALDVIDANSLEKIKSIPTESRLHDIVLTRDGKYAVATSPNAKSVLVFDLQKLELDWKVNFDRGAMVPTVESGPGGSTSRIFVQLSGFSGFAVVDFEKRQEVARINYPDDEPSISPGNAVSHGIGVAPDGKTLWAISRSYNCVFVYSLPDLKLQGRVYLPEIKPPGHDPISGSPNWVTFTPDSKMVYVANGADRSVSAIDMKAMKAVARIPAGEQPGRMSTSALP